MPTYLAPGVYVEEVDKGPKPIEAVATAVTGFVGLAARGPLNRPVAVNTWSDYVRVFGGFAPDSLLSYAVFGYFNNGGQNAYVVRVANDQTMSRARQILSYRPVGRQSTYAAAAAITAGASHFGLNAIAGLPVGSRLQFVEGDSTEVVTLEAVKESDMSVVVAPALAHAYTTPVVTVLPGLTPPARYALADAAAVGATEIQLADVRGLAVGDRIALWDAAENPELFRIVEIGADHKVKLNRTLAQAYTKAAMVVPNPALQLVAASAGEGKGSWGNDIQVRVDESSLVRTALDGALAATATDAKLKSVKGIAPGSLLRFFDRQAQHEVYRTVTKVYADTNSVVLDGAVAAAFTEANTEVTSVEFKLSLRHRWSGAAEVFDGLSMEQAYAARFAVTAVNADRGEARASQLVEVRNLVDDAWTEVTREAKLPVPMKKGVWISLQGGSNGSVGVTVDHFKGQNLGPDNRSGLAAFEGVDQVTMVVCPDAVGSNELGEALLDAAGVQAVHGALLEHAELMRDRFAIIDSRKGMDLQAVQEQRENLSSRYGALYYPWIAVDNPLDSQGGQILVPPSGHLAGLYARVDQQRGVHKAPANEILFGVRKLEVQVSAAEQNLLNPLGINCIRQFPGRGIRVWGARTLADDAQWRYINVRRLFLQIEESVEQGTQWTVFEPNGSNLWAKVRRDVSAFLYRFYLQGAFAGGAPEEAFYVKCDAETNPPEVVDAGQVVIEVGIAPSKPAEFVVFHIGQKATGGAVKE